MEENLNIEIPDLHPAQEKILSEARRFNVVCCGRRWGKTLLAETILLDSLFQYDADGSLIGGYPVGWFGPVAKTNLAAFNDLKNYLAPLNPCCNENTGRIHLPLIKNASIDFWTLSGDTAGIGRSRKYKTIIIDEAAHVKDLEQILTTAIFPTLADYQGSAWFLSTPLGTANYFKVLFDRGQNPHEKQWKSWQLPTSTNQYILPEELELQRSLLTPANYAQEYEAQFLSFDGQVFKNVRNCATATYQNAPLPEHLYVCGVDWGKVSDATVFSIFDVTTQELVAIDYISQRSYVSQVEKLKKWHEYWNFRKILVERNSIGEPLLEQLALAGLPIEGFNTTMQSKATLIDDLAWAFENDSIKIIDHPTLIGELENFEAKINDLGNTRYAAPDGAHDDCVMSLALAYRAAKPTKNKPSLKDMLRGFDRAKIRI